MAVLKYWDETLSEWLPVAPGPKGDKGDKGDTGDLANLLYGEYTQRGKTVTVTIRLVIGTTLPTGLTGWTFTLPFTVDDTLGYSGAAYIYDSGSNYYGGWVRGYSDKVAVVPSAGGYVGDGAPITWAAGDELRITATDIKVA